MSEWGRSQFSNSIGVHMDLFVNSDITLGFQKLLDLPFFADGTYQENEAPTNIGYKHWLLLTDFF